MAGRITILHRIICENKTTIAYQFLVTSLAHHDGPSHTKGSYKKKMLQCVAAEYDWKSLLKRSNAHWKYSFS